MIYNLLVEILKCVICRQIHYNIQKISFHTILSKNSRFHYCCVKKSVKTLNIILNNKRLKDFDTCKNLVSSIFLNFGSKLKLFIRYLFPKIGQTKLRIPNLNYLRKTTSTSASRLCVGHFALKMGFCCLINNGLVVAAKNVCHPYHNGVK